MNDSEVLVKYIEDNISLSQEERQYIMMNAPIRMFDKNEKLLEEGEIMSNWYFVIEGCIRMFYVVDGLEKTTAFYQENDIVNSWHSFLNQSPAKHYLECIEPCKLAVISYEVDQEAFHKFEMCNQASRIRLTQEAARFEEIISSLLTKDSTQRYLSFAEKHPAMLNRISLKDLATYLNMRPETLSRIRNKLANSYYKGD